MENNRYVKLTESELKQVINEAVIKILQENQENEGFWDNMKSALKGAKQGFNTQKHLDSNVDTDYTRNTRMSPNEMPSNDAAETVRQLYKMASEYHIKANKLRNRAEAIAERYGVNVTNGKGKGKLANKVVNYDVSTDFKGNAPDIRGRHSNFTTKASVKGNQPQNNAWKVQK